MESPPRSFLEDPSKITEIDRTDCGLRAANSGIYRKRAERMDCGQKAGGEAVASPFDLFAENEEVFGEDVMATLNLYCWKRTPERHGAAIRYEPVVYFAIRINVANDAATSGIPCPIAHFTAMSTCRVQSVGSAVHSEQRSGGRAAHAAGDAFGRMDAEFRGSFCRG